MPHNTNWVNTTTFDLAWVAASDADTGNSGINHYRVIAPAESAPAAPASESDGTTAGSGTSASGLSIAAGAQGELTGYLFAVDDDKDRPNDGKYGQHVAFTVRVDTNPPPKFADFQGNNNLGEVEDTTSQIKLNWAARASEKEAAGPRQRDDTALSPFASYRIYYVENQERDPTTGDNYFDANSGYGELFTYSTDEVLLTGLSAGYEYRLALAGVDAAGNVGPLSDVVTVKLDIFGVSHAFANEDSETVIQWEGSDTSPYDVIYADSTGYTVQVDSLWKLAATVIGTQFVDEGGTDAGSNQTRVKPMDLANNWMRFYRVAPVNAWIPAEGKSGAASEEVIVAHKIALAKSNNFIGVSMVPMVDTLAEFLGTNRLPYAAEAKTSPDATRIYLYTNTATGSPVDDTLWLSPDGWLDGAAAPANDTALPYPYRGFDLHVGAATSLLMVGRVPYTNADPVVIEAQKYNVLSMNLPRPTKLSELGLRDKLVWGRNFLQADDLRVMEKGTAPYGSPRGRFYVSTNGVFMNGDTGQNAENFLVYPDEAIIVHAKKSTEDIAVNWSPNAFTSYNYKIPSVEITNNFAAAPSVKALTVTVSDSTNATLRGSVNPNGLVTKYWFRYGTSTNYGTNTDQQNLPATNVAINVSSNLYGLTPGSRYYFQVVASNSAGLSRLGSSSFQLGCEAITITTATLPTGTVGSTYSTTVAASGAGGTYTFSRGGGTLPDGLGITGSGSSSGSITGTPTAAGSYTFTVLATDNNGCTGTRSLSMVVINTPGSPPSTPTVTAADGESTAKVDVSWTDVTGEDAYEVLRHTANSSGSATKIVSLAANTVLYADISAVPGQLYYYWVVATNSAGASAAGTANTGYRKLATVSGVTASSNTYSDKIVVGWTDGAGETAYSIWRHTLPVAADAEYVSSVTAGATTYNDTTALPGQDYYYWVRATNNTSASQSDMGAYAFGLRQVTGTGAGLSVTPLTLDFGWVMMGSNAPARNFTVSNVGMGDLYYTNYLTYGEGDSGWLNVNPVSTNLLPGASQQHNLSLVLASVTNAGSWTATNRVAGNQTNAAVNVVVTLVVSNLPNPTAVSAYAQGTNTVSLSWTKSQSYSVLVVHCETNPPPMPKQGQLLTVGSTNVGGGSKVIYKGSATSYVHTNRAGSVNYYHFHSYNGNFYSPGAEASATLP